MAKNRIDDVNEKDMTDDVEEVVETEEEAEIETTETVEPEIEDTDTETESETEPEQEQEENEPESEPEQPKKPVNTSQKKDDKKKQEEDTDAELDAFFEKLRKAKEKQQSKEKAKKDGEKTFTQAEFEKALKSALAKRLPSKEEREQFEKWRESQQTMEEKMSVLRVTNSKLEEELESLKHENLIIKAGVEKDAVEFIQYKVEKMGGDFEDNLQDFLKENKRYIAAPKTTIVEAAEHKPKVKTAITKKDLDKMGYVERAKYREEHPEEYAKAMGR